MPTPKTPKVQDMASEYRFDYKKPNRFANKMNLNVNWTVEKFVEGEKSKIVAKTKPAAKAKPKKKK